MKRTSANGLSYSVDGPADAPALVLVNSIGLTATIWDGQVPAYSRHFRTIRYDQRGHGASRTQPPPYTIADLGGDLIGLLDELGIGRASICGISLGGLIAMWVGAHHPDRVDRLVLACTSAYPHDDAKWFARVKQARTEGMRAVVEQGSKGWFTPAFAAAHPDLLERLRSIVAKTAVDGYVGCCDALRTANLLPDLAAIAAPTLIVAGGQDRGFPIAHAEALRTGIRDSRLFVLDDAAHIACVEAPEAFNRITLEHLLGR